MLLTRLSFRVFWIHGICRASFGFSLFSGFHSKQAFINSIRSGSLIFRASARDRVEGCLTRPFRF